LHGTTLRTTADNTSTSGKIAHRIPPRLLASNALRANLSKHMVLNQMADSKAGMILTAASLITTIALTQFGNLPVLTVLILAATSTFATLG